MPHQKNKKGGKGAGGSPDPGPSKRDKHSSDEDDDPFPKKDSRLSKQGKMNKKVPSSANKMGGMHTSCHNKPAELFRKDLISAMKLADTEILYESEYVVISDPWRQEWEKGVQVPVNEGEIMPVSIASLNKDTSSDFKLPPRKFLHDRTDDTYVPGQHELTGMQEMADQIVRYDLDDQDVQWLELVNEDREEMGLQLINEWNLERMIEELENQCYAKTNVLKKTEEGLGIEYDEDVACDVCRLLESEDTNEMVFCDGCDICVHQACYGIQTIPEGTWLCRICALGIKPMCLLCPKRGGAMKPTKSATKWTHVSCALWIPEVSIGCPEKMEPITKISNIPPSRWALVCCLCKERVGACIQCSVKQCKTAFHVTCGFAHNLDMRTIVDENDDVDGIVLRAYCPKHSKNRNASDTDSPKREEESQEEDENDISEAEMAKKRMEKLNQLEEEFYTLVDQGEVARKFYIPEEAVNIVTEYWKLKRKVNNNKPLITPKMEEEDQMQRQQKDSLCARMKMFVHLRQDLERARNLCYMIGKREKTKRQLFNTKESVFRYQLQILTDSDSSLSAREAESIRQMTRFSSIYCDLRSKSGHDKKPPRENLFTLENLKTPKDHEEEKERANEKKDKEKVKKEQKSGEKSGRKSATEKKQSGAEEPKNKGKGKSAKSVGKDKGSAVNVVAENKTKREDEECKVDVDSLTPVKEQHLPNNSGDEFEENPLQSRSGKLDVKEAEVKAEAEGARDTETLVGDEPDSPSKKNLIPSDLKKKLTSILQSKTMMQQRQEKSEPTGEMLHIDVENSDSEVPSSGVNTEVAAPTEERRNLFDQFSVQGVEAKVTPPLPKQEEKAPPLSPEKTVEGNTSAVKQSPGDLSLETSPEDERLRGSSSHKKTKRRKRSRSSHKHKRPRGSVSPATSDCRPLSISPIIIKTEGDSIVSKQVLPAPQRDRSPLSPEDARNDSLHRHRSGNRHSSSSKSKKKRSRRDRHSDSDNGKNSSTPTKLKWHPLPMSPLTKDNVSTDLDQDKSGIEDTTGDGAQETTHEGSPLTSKEEVKLKIRSKLRLKKQTSPVKGVVSYEVIKDDDDEEDEQQRSNAGERCSQTSDSRACQSRKDKNIFESVQDNTSLNMSDQKPDKFLSKSEKSEKRHEQAVGRRNSSSKIPSEEKQKELNSEVKEEGSDEHSKTDETGPRTRNSRLSNSDGLTATVKKEPENGETQSDRTDLEVSASAGRREKRTRSRVANQEAGSPGDDLDDTSDENFHPGSRSPKILPLDKSQRPRRLSSKRQPHLDETEGEEGDDAGDDSGEAEKRDDHHAMRKKSNNSNKANSIARRGVKLKSPLPDKPELNRLLLDPSKLMVKDSLKRRVGDKLASALKGRSRWPTIKSNQMTLDNFVKRTNSCENVFNKPDIRRDSNLRRSSSHLARSDLSPLSVNKSSTVVNNSLAGQECDPILVSPTKRTAMATNTIFGAHSSPRGSLSSYRIPRRSQNSSPLGGRLRDHNSPAGDCQASRLSPSTTNDPSIVFGDAEKLQRHGLRRQLSFENIVEGRHSGSAQRFRDSSLDLQEVMKTPSKCDSSELTEDTLDGSQSYRSPSPVSSITSVASSRLGRLRGVRGVEDEDDDESSPAKRVTRSQIQEEVGSPSTRLRSREGGIVRPPKLTLS